MLRCLVVSHVVPERYQDGDVANFTGPTALQHDFASAITDSRVIDRDNLHIGSDFGRTSRSMALAS